MYNPSLYLSRNNSGARSTTLTHWNPTFHDFINEVSTPVVGNKDGSYFLRCAGTVRNDRDTAKTASILILDGDSSIAEDGEVVPGAPDPHLVNQILTSLGFQHVIYSSYSNDVGLHKYRVIIPVKYTQAQLPILLDHFHELLHSSGAMLFNVKENKVWSQPWFFPRVTAQRKQYFKVYSFVDGEELNADEICGGYKLSSAAPRQIKQSTKSRVSYVPGQIDPIELFNQYHLSPVNYLLKQGYRADGNRLIPPNSTTGTAGIQICESCGDGVERVFSHNGSDPLNDGYAHDAFDCFKIIEHGGDEREALNAVGKMFNIEGVPLIKYNQKAWGAYQNGRPFKTVNVTALGGVA